MLDDPGMCLWRPQKYAIHHPTDQLFFEVNVKDQGRRDQNKFSPNLGISRL